MIIRAQKLLLGPLVNLPPCFNVRWFFPASSLLGFQFDERERLCEEGVYRVHAHRKGDAVYSLLQSQGLQPKDCICVGDSEMDLSMHIPGLPTFPTTTVRTIKLCPLACYFGTGICVATRLFFGLPPQH